MFFTPLKCLLWPLKVMVLADPSSIMWLSLWYHGGEAERQVNNFMGKSGALGSSLTGTHKAAPEANKTCRNSKTTQRSQLGGEIRHHSKQDRRWRNHHFNETKTASSWNVSLNESSSHSQGRTAQAAEDQAWNGIRWSLNLHLNNSK